MPRKDHRHDDVQDELQAHIDHRADDLKRAGVGADEAQRRAHQEFGALDRYVDRCRDERRLAWLRAVPDQLWRECRFAVRRLMSAPIYATFSVLSLALGLGVTAAIYSVMHAILWPAQGITDPGGIAVLRSSSPILDSGYATSRADLEFLRARQTTMSGVAAWTTFNQPFTEGEVAERFRGEAITGNAFEVFGIATQVGRAIRPSDDAPEAPAVVVLSHAFWSTRLRSDASVIGRIVRLGRQPFEVIGVTSPAFATLGRADFEGAMGWVPLEALRRFSRNPSALVVIGSNRFSISAAGRLLPGRTIADASAELSVIGQQLDAVNPYPVSSDMPGRDRSRRWSAQSASRAFTTSGAYLAWLIVALVGLVLVVACTNLANLTLARGSARQTELAVRRALGASRWRLVREQLLESVLVAVAGGACALVLVRVILVIAQGQVPPGVQFDLLTSPPADVVVAIAIALLMTLCVFGLWPALHATKHDPRAGLASDAGTAGAIRWRARGHLIASQVAISAGFLVFAVMCVRAVTAETRGDAGSIDVDHLAMARLNFRDQIWDEAKARRAVDRLLELAASQPGVERSAVTSGFPIGFTYDAEVAPVADAFRPGVDYPTARFISATPSFFQTLDTSLLHGRLFDVQDAAGASLVAVVSDDTARAAFGTADIVGRSLRYRIATLNTGANPEIVVTVIGVVANASQEGRGSRGALYVPFAQHFMPNVDLVVRTSGNAEALLIPLRTLVRQADPDLFADRAVTGTYRLDNNRWGLRYFGAVAMILGVIALVLAMAGLAGVLAHLVARRTREMGLRMALGATAGDIGRLVLRDGLRPVLQGMGFGLVIGFIGRQAFEPIADMPLSFVDLVVLVAVPVPLIVAALVACYVPARRASRVEPTVALKDL